MKQTIVAMVLTAVISLVAANTALANTIYKQAVAVDVLVGSDDITGVRIGYRPYTHKITTIPFFDGVEIYWEFSVNFWEYGVDNNHETNFVFALSPVISKTFYHVKGRYPLKWEAGIGLSLVEDTRFAGKDIGSHYQFEDRVGLTLAFGHDLRQSTSLRYMHYSNGGLNSKNPGVDFLNLAYAYRF